MELQSLSLIVYSAPFTYQNDCLPPRYSLGLGLTLNLNPLFATSSSDALNYAFFCLCSLTT